MINAYTLKALVVIAALAIAYWSEPLYEALFK